MKLSLQLGIPYSRLAEEISSAELSLYMAYDRIQPFGDYRADIRNAQILHQQAEMHRNREKDPEPYTLNDFIPFQPYGVRVESKKDRTSRAATSQMRENLRKLAKSKET